jgi:hypothetical protein
MDFSSVPSAGKAGLNAAKSDQRASTLGRLLLSACFRLGLIRILGAIKAKNRNLPRILVSRDRDLTIGIGRARNRQETSSEVNRLLVRHSEPT